MCLNGLRAKKTSNSFCPSTLKTFLLPMCHLLQGKLWENFLWTMYAKIFIKKTFQSWIRPRQHLCRSFCRLVLWFTYTIHLLQQQKILQPATKLRHPRQSKNRQLQREFYIQYICFSSAVYSGVVWVWAVMNFQSCFYLDSHSILWYQFFVSCLYQPLYSIVLNRRYSVSVGKANFEVPQQSQSLHLAESLCKRINQITPFSPRSGEK